MHPSSCPIPVLRVLVDLRGTAGQGQWPLRSPVQTDNPVLREGLHVGPDVLHEIPPALSSLRFGTQAMCNVPGADTPQLCTKGRCFLFCFQCLPFSAFLHETADSSLLWGSNSHSPNQFGWSTDKKDSVGRTPGSLMTYRVSHPLLATILLQALPRSSWVAEQLKATPSLGIRNLRLGDIKWFVQGHPATKWKMRIKTQVLSTPVQRLPLGTGLCGSDT